MSKLKIGVIGAGSISDSVCQSYANNDQVEIYAICDLNEKRAEDKAAQSGAQKVYVDYHDIVKDPDIDAVSICRWNTTHADIAIAALNNRKNVLARNHLQQVVEKALEVEEAVKQSGKTLQVGFVRRYDQHSNYQAVCRSG